MSDYLDENYHQNSGTDLTTTTTTEPENSCQNVIKSTNALDKNVIPMSAAVIPNSTVFDSSNEPLKNDIYGPTKKITVRRYRLKK